MADCKRTAKCLFFNDKMEKTPTTASMMKKKYCQGSFTECARYMVAEALGPDKVPTDLFPGQMDRAMAMIG